MNIGEALDDAQALKDLNTAIPKSMPRLLSQLRTWCRDKHSFAYCSLDSVLNSIGKAEKMGLGIGGILSDSVLEPLEVTQGAWSARLVPTVRGLLRLSGAVTRFGVVRASDGFEAGSEIRHTHRLGSDSGAVVAVYCMGIGHEVMTKRQVQEVENLSLLKDTDTWQKNWTETALRVCLRRHLKYRALDPEVIQHLEDLDLEEFGDLASRQAAGQIQPLPAEPPPQAERAAPEPVRNNEDFGAQDDAALGGGRRSQPQRDAVFDGTPRAEGPPAEEKDKKQTWGCFFGIFENGIGHKADGKEDMNTVSHAITKTYKALLPDHDFGDKWRVPDIVFDCTKAEVRYVLEKAKGEAFDRVVKTMKAKQIKQREKAQASGGF